MPCTPIKFPGGSGIVCTRGRHIKKCKCGKIATLLCDHIVGRNAKTCDEPMCTNCATEIGKDRHLCKYHSALNTAPITGDLF